MSARSRFHGAFSPGGLLLLPLGSPSANIPLPRSASVSHSDVGSVAGGMLRTRILLFFVIAMFATIPHPAVSLLPLSGPSYVVSSASVSTSPGIPKMPLVVLSTHR